MLAQQDFVRDLDEARAEIARLTSEIDDLKLLYEATIEHGVAVEDELAEKNLLLERTRLRLDEELADAGNYIRSILPLPRATVPLSDWMLVPSNELGGDSFGHHDIDADNFAIYLLDVCGHGVGAALLSVTAINVLRARALPGVDFRDPAAVLKGLNNAFPMERQNNMFFTIWYGVYQRSTGTLRFATGGHPPAIHLRGGAAPAVTELVTPGCVAIGVLADLDYRADQIAIEPGDRLLVLSDGAFELDGADGEELGFAEFVRASQRLNGDPSAIFEWIRSFSRPGPLPDDFSLLRLRF